MSFPPGSIVKTLIKKFRLRRANKKTKNKHDPLKNRGEISNIYHRFPPKIIPTFASSLYNSHFRDSENSRFFSGNSPNLYENSTKTLPFD